MAEQEARILIKEIIAPCNDCSGAGENVCDNCCDWDMWNSCFTREQAIEKMAKALCRTYGEDCETCRFNGNEKGCKRYLEFRNYIAMAEAALNELLEGHDDEK